MNTYYVVTLYNKNTKEHTDWTFRDEEMVFVALFQYIMTRQYPEHMPIELVRVEKRVIQYQKSYQVPL